MRNVRRVLGVAWFLAAAVPLASQPFQAVRPEDAGRIAEANRRATEVSKWRHIAKPPIPAGKDAVDPRIRSARDQFYDRLIGAHAPLGTPEALGAGFANDRGPDRGPEIGQSDVVAVVTFDDYQPYLSSSRWSIYTEVRLTVEHIVKFDPSGSPPPTLTLIYPGGTITTPSGIISYGNSLDTPFDLQPHHRYVVFLRHAPSGDFYWLDKSWELRDGVVYPNSPGNVERAKAGTSLYSGMREEEFLALLPSLVNRQEAR
jgi:hypothetical protein